MFCRLYRSSSIQPLPLQSLHCTVSQCEELSLRACNIPFPPHVLQGSLLIINFQTNDYFIFFHSFFSAFHADIESVSPQLGQQFILPPNFPFFFPHSENRLWQDAHLNSIIFHFTPFSIYSNLYLTLNIFGDYQ